MLEPKLAQSLMKSKDIREFISFLSKEVNGLNTISDIETEDPTLLAIEIKARKLAFTKLVKILEPLLNSREEQSKFNKSEYIT